MADAPSKYYKSTTFSKADTEPKNFVLVSAPGFNIIYEQFARYGYFKREIARVFCFQNTRGGVLYFWGEFLKVEIECYGKRVGAASVDQYGESWGAGTNLFLTIRPFILNLKRGAAK